MSTAAERLPLATKDNRANLIRAFKANGCAGCKARYPELDWSDLHVDHIDPRTKMRYGAVASLTGGGSIGGGRSGAESLLAELLLCQVLCVKCHKEKHRNGVTVSERQLALFNGSGAWTYQ